MKKLPFHYQQIYQNIGIKTGFFVFLRMQHITGISRQQMRVSSLEDAIRPDNQVLFIDAFVEFVDLNKLGFAVQTLKEEGRPSYNSKVFLKIYLYGYLNGIRSGRKLENETIRNIEMQWLLEGIHPNYHSISDFRKNNPVALKNLFKLFVSFLKDADLIGGETIAIDGTKSRAHNSKKANFNQKKIDKHLEYIEAKTQEYLNALKENDAKENHSKIQNIQQKINRLKGNKLRYGLLEEKLKDSGEPQVSTTDNDARALLVQGQVVEISFNIQAAVDAKHNLVVATHTINRNDRSALSAIPSCSDLEGNIKVFRQFWIDEQENTNSVHPLLAYADLMNKGDRRCTETAQKIYDEYL